MAKKPGVGELAPDFELRVPTARSSCPIIAASGSCSSSIPAINAGLHQQFCSYRDRAEDFAALDATVVGISSQDLDSHEAFTAKHSLNVPLLADIDKAVAKAYSAAPARLGTSARSIVIDEQGIVRRPPRSPARVGLPVRRRAQGGARRDPGREAFSDRCASCVVPGLAVAPAARSRASRRAPAAGCGLLAGRRASAGAMPPRLSSSHELWLSANARSRVSSSSARSSRRLDRRGELDAVVEVARHQVGGGDVDRVLAVALEV